MMELIVKQTESTSQHLSEVKRHKSLKTIVYKFKFFCWN